MSKNLVLSFVFVLGMQLWRINENTFQMRVFHKQFVGLDTGGNGIDVVAVAGTPGMSETFEIVWNSGDSGRVRIKAPNGFFLQVSVCFVFVFDSVVFNYECLFVLWACELLQRRYFLYQYAKQAFIV